MALYTIGDTHLSLSADKPMDIFGGGWEGYVDKLREGFSCVSEEDTVVPVSYTHLDVYKRQVKEETGLSVSQIKIIEADP